MKILDEKMEFIASGQAEIVATANVGCMLQLAAGAKRKGLNSRSGARDGTCWTRRTRTIGIASRELSRRHHFHHAGSACRMRRNVGLLC